MIAQIKIAKPAAKILLTNDENPRGHKISPKESSNLKTKPQEYPLGKEWDFFWHRFIREL